MLINGFADRIEAVADHLFMPWVVGVLLAAGLFLTLRTSAVQVRRFPDAGRVALVRPAPAASGALTPLAALTTTPFTQPNSIALVINSVFGIPKLWAGIVIAVLTWLVIIGGIKSIGRAAERLSPLKVGLYLIGGLIVILFNAARIPGVFSMIVREALTVHSALGFGGFIAVRYGIARGIYANEAGYGTAPVA